MTWICNKPWCRASTELYAEEQHVIFMWFTREGESAITELLPMRMMRRENA